MQDALSDFRIESDAVVWLSFSNGATYRVSPNDLERYVERDDLLRIRRAISMRNQFMRRVLPPTAMVLLLAGIIGLGSHDMQRVEALSHPTAKVTTHCVPAKMLPTNVTPKAASKTATTEADATGLGGSNVGSSSVSPMSSIRSTSENSGMAKTTSVVKAGVSAPGETQLPLGVGQAAAPVTQTVQNVVNPVTQIVHPVTQAVSPVTAAAGHLLGGL